MTTLSRIAIARRNAPRGGYVARLFAFVRLSNERKRLKSLTDAQLDDIGVSRAQAIAEANRALWDAPSHWKR